MNVADQLKYLSDYQIDFIKKINAGNNQVAIHSDNISTFQINLGKRCNQACRHCHVEASPIRTENMDKRTVDKCIEIIESTANIKTVDITGGAPEMNSHFRALVLAATRSGKKVIDRCNLTILEEPGYEYLYDFLREHRVEIVASLPHYSINRTDSQRGKGVFDRSIKALKKLNRYGYGKDLGLNLVYNPSGLFLSGDQSSLEKEFKYQLKNNFAIEFNHLYCINNMPINRFLESLIKKAKFLEYMDVLVQAFNPATIAGLMCRSQVSIDYLGNIYDCDFNQMLEMKTQPISSIWQWDEQLLRNRKIKLANHCFGCTAGAGSSCGGEIL